AVARRSAPGVDPDTLSDDHFGPSPRVTATSQDPAQVVSERECFQEIARCRQQLPEKEACLLDLWLEEMPCKEVALRLGISLSELKRRWARLRTKLQRMLAPLLPRH